MNNSYLKIASALVASLLAVGVQAQDLSRGGSRMVVQPLIDGCTAPGGLFPITSSDGPMDAPYWCGAPPYCLTMPVGNVERCHIIPGVRQGGLRGVRDPQDLRCDVTNVNPTGPTHATPGRCPVAPTLGATINGLQAATVSQGANVTLRVNTASATPLSAPTSLTMACTGPNAGISPFNQTNLANIAGRDHTYSAVAAVNAGSTSCTITASNAAGTATYQVSFNATPTVTTPAPTITARFNPTNPAVGGSVNVITSTTNATSLVWSCSGRWVLNNQARPVGNVTTSHSATNSAGTTNCTFTARGPGGTATATASWTSTAGGGGGGTDPEVTLQNCNARTITLPATRYECYANRPYCNFNLPNMNNGSNRRLYGIHGDYCGGGAQAEINVTCRNGSFVVNGYQCNMWDGGS